MPPIETVDMNESTRLNKDIFPGHKEPGLYDVPGIEDFSTLIDDSQDREAITNFLNVSGSHKQAYMLILNHLQATSPELPALPVMIGELERTRYLLTEPYFLFERTGGEDEFKAVEITALLALPHGIFEISVRPTLTTHIEDLKPPEPDPKDTVRLVIKALSSQDLLKLLIALEPPAGRGVSIQIPNNEAWLITKKLLDPEIMASERKIQMIIEKLAEAAKVPQRTTSEMLDSVGKNLATSS